MTRITNSHGTGIDLPNGTGVQVRTKAKDLFASIFTLNQGSGTLTAAEGLAAYVPFIDGNTLKIQNAANNGQVTLGDVSLTNFGHAGLSAANTFTSTNIFENDVTFDGATAGRDIVFDRSDNALEFADNAKAVFGTGGDLELSHDASDSTIENKTGILFIKNTDTNGSQIQLLNNNNGIKIQGKTGEQSIVALADSGVEVYFNNVKKFESVSGGVSLTGGAAANITALTSATTITIDMALSCHHSVTLAHNATFAAPSNQAIGQSGSIIITQDSTGSRTGTFNTAFKFTGGSAPTLSTAAGAIDRIDYLIVSSNVIHCAVSLDVKQAS